MLSSHHKVRSIYVTLSPVDLANNIPFSLYFAVAVDCSRVEISLKKEVPHQQWESIGTFGNGHARLNAKSRRGMYVYI